MSSVFYADVQCIVLRCLVYLTRMSSVFYADVQCIVLGCLVYFTRMSSVFYADVQCIVLGCLVYLVRCPVYCTRMSCVSSQMSSVLYLDVQCIVRGCPVYCTQMSSVLYLDSQCINSTDGCPVYLVRCLVYCSPVFLSVISFSKNFTIHSSKTKGHYSIESLKQSFLILLISNFFLRFLKNIFSVN